jgi:hypothetical protein
MQTGVYQQAGTEMAQDEEDLLLYFPIDLLLFAPEVFTGSRNNTSFRFSSILMFACLPVCVVVVCCWTGFRPKKENSVVQRWRDLICPFITRKSFVIFTRAERQRRRRRNRSSLFVWKNEANVDNLLDIIETMDRCDKPRRK